jgi:hypothetical protein
VSRLPLPAACAALALLAPAAVAQAPAAPPAAQGSATAVPTPLPAPGTAQPPVALTDPATFAGPPAAPPGGWRSVARGRPWRGRLERGVELPAAGPDHLTWDAVLRRSPNRAWRRWGTDRLVVTLLQVAGQFRAAHPDAAPLLIADLSRPRGGIFDQRFGGLGHLSHRNGLDADVPYPRRDGRPRAPRRAADVDRVLAQELVDRLLAAGAEKIFVGPSLGLRGPRDVVIELAHHDDHLHVRLPGRAPAS